MPTINGMARDGEPFTGFLYAGLMIDSSGQPRTVEFNCRLGDPETQPIMMRLKSDLFEMLMHATDGTLDKVDLEWDRRIALGVVMAAAGYPLDAAQGRRRSPASCQKLPTRWSSMPAPGSTAGTWSAAGGRVLVRHRARRFVQAGAAASLRGGAGHPLRWRAVSKRYRPPRASSADRRLAMIDTAAVRSLSARPCSSSIVGDDRSRGGPRVRARRLDPPAGRPAAGRRPVATDRGRPTDRARRLQFFACARAIPCRHRRPSTGPNWPARRSRRWAFRW